MNQLVTFRESETGPATEVDPPTRSLCVQGGGLTLAGLFRVLDVLRRELARAARGNEGAFAGFDVLDVSAWRGDDEVGRVRFTARVVSEAHTSQTVAYTASRCSHTDGGCQDSDTSEVYLRASGRTVALPNRRPTPRPPQAPSFVIASPHR